MKIVINSQKAPKAIGPYSQAVMKNGTLYLSGQLPINPETGKFAGDTIEEQTKQSLENAKAILEEAGIGLEDVLKVTVLLNSIEDFGKMNEVYGTYFTNDFPARAAYEVAKLPLGALVEIEMIAAK